MKKTVLCIITLAAVLLQGCARNPGVLSGTIIMAVGTTKVVSNKAEQPCTVDMKIHEGDVIKTGTDSVVVAEIGQVRVEIQPNAEFTVNSMKERVTELFLSRGNCWLQMIGRAKRGNTVKLSTKTTLAAVRGTKFYTFTMGEFQGTCFCEGEVDFSDSSGSYAGRHKKDYLTVTKDGVTAVILPEDLAFMNFEHNHSTLNNSPLGKKQSPMPPEMMKRYRAIIEKKYAEAKMSK